MANSNNENGGNRNVHFRLNEENDMRDIMNLFRVAFPTHQPDEKIYRWHFMDNPVSPMSCAVAVIDDKIVAHAGFSGRHALVNSKNDLLFVKQTSMSDKSVRGTGVYSQLLTWANKQLVQRGGKIAISYPNASNHPVQIMRDDYYDICQIPALQKTFPQTGRVIEATGDLPGRLLDFNFVFLNDYDELWQATLAGERFGIVHDAEYMTWRYARRPDIDYYLLEDRTGGNLNSAIVWKFYPHDKPEKIMIVDWLHTCHDESAMCLFENLEIFAAHYGLSIAIWQNVYRKKMHKLVEKRSYVLSLPIVYFGAFPLVEPEMLGHFHDYRHWYVAMSDVDIF